MSRRCLRSGSRAIAELVITRSAPEEAVYLTVRRAGHPVTAQPIFGEIIPERQSYVPMESAFYR